MCGGKTSMVQIIHSIEPSRFSPLSFADWWRKTMRRVSKEHRKGVNSLIILGAWIIWKHRNACVFEGASPSISMIWSELKTSTASGAWLGRRSFKG
jgi:hypothetical protein